MRLDPASVQLLIVDFQERLYAAMPEGVREQALKNADNLRWLADEAGIPVVVTEQYPQGLGPTLPALGVPAAIAKTTFSALGEPAVLPRLARRNVVVLGVETHICVALTVQDLRERGYGVAVAGDACLSRRKQDWRDGLEWMRALGAHVLPTETILFGLLGRAGTPAFKEVSRRIR